MEDIEKVLKDINKSIKLGSIKLGVAYEDIEKIPFSSPRLNYITHGGLPVGRIVEFYGSDGSGKTTTALDICAQAQRLYPNKKVLFCDIEHTFDTNWASKMGVDTENILYFDPDAMGAEDVFNVIIKMINELDISVCVLDSIGAMVSNLSMYDKQIGEKTYGGISMSLTEFSKKVTPILAKTKTLLIGINQLRDDMNSAYGGTTTVGGRNFRHSCSIRLGFRKGNFIDDKGNKVSRACENPAGNLVLVDLTKSKVCPQDRKTGYYTLRYLTGIDNISDTIDVAVLNGCINQAGAWYSIIDIDTGEIMKDDEDNMLKFQGEAKLHKYLSENHDILDYITQYLNTSME